jgi:hypothetical protein
VVAFIVLNINYQLPNPQKRGFFILLIAFYQIRFIRFKNVLDLFDRKIKEWSVSDEMGTEIMHQRH